MELTNGSHNLGFPADLVHVAADELTEHWRLYCQPRGIQRIVHRSGLFQVFDTNFGLEGSYMQCDYMLHHKPENQVACKYECVCPLDDVVPCTCEPWDYDD